MFHSLLVRLGLVAALCGAAAAPAAAYKWPGDSPGLGSAISAKVIGQHCAGLLSASDIREVDAYLAKAASELATKPDSRRSDGLPLHELFMRRLAEIYAKKYADPTACDADTAEEAQDTLRKVRSAMRSGRPLFPDDNDPSRKPDVDEAITAKVTGEKCHGVLTLLELAEIELYLVRQWVWWARHAVERDARSAIDGYKAAEQAIASGWSPRDCTEAAVGKAKRVAALVRRTQAANTP
ncbi:MAG: hypothetical protein J2P51_04460 [Hyphomicrobiaceae bacterium]|nr:hypothetical protein [Hyphomicrobiaceae bacterium]